jgi:hypothetical protein
MTIFAVPKKKLLYAEVAQLVEHHLAKVGVAGSSLVFRSLKGVGSLTPFFMVLIQRQFFAHKFGVTRVVEPAYRQAGW